MSPLQVVGVNPAHHSELEPGVKMAAADGDDSLYPIAVLIDELRNEDVQVCVGCCSWGLRGSGGGLFELSCLESGVPGTAANPRFPLIT